jgi:hypothetical protein
LLRLVLGENAVSEQQSWQKQQVRNLHLKVC